MPTGFAFVTAHQRNEQKGRYCILARSSSLVIYVGDIKILKARKAEFMRPQRMTEADV